MSAGRGSASGARSVGCSPGWARPRQRCDVRRGEHNAEHAAIGDLGDLEQALAARSLAALWNSGPADIPHEPAPEAVAQHWAWADLEPLLTAAGRLVAPDDLASRRRVPARAICLTNRGLEGLRTTDTRVPACSTSAQARRCPTSPHLSGGPLRAHRQRGADHDR